MKELHLRKYHRIGGIIFALFIVLQALTGIVLSIEDVLGVYWGGILHDIHDGFGRIGGVYRIILGVGLVWMVVSGGTLARIIHLRQTKRR